MFNNLNIPQNVEKEVDYVGTGFQVLDSGIYKATIKQAYGMTSQGGAKGLTVVFQINVDGQTREHTERFWITNKKGEVSYTNKDGKVRFLPGYVQANDLIKLVTNVDLTGAKFEKRTLPVYSYEQRKETPTEVDAAVDLFGKEVALAILKVRENRTNKVNGEFVPTSEEQFLNEIDKIMILKAGVPTTLNEVESDAKSEFADKWIARWKGKLRDKYKPVSDSGSTSTKTVELDIG